MAKAHLWATLKSIRKDPTLVILKVVLDFLRNAFALAVAAFIVFIPLLFVVVQSAEHGFVAAILLDLPAFIRSPDFLWSVGRVIFCAWMISFAMQSFTMSAIWKISRAWARGHKTRPVDSALSLASDGFPTAARLILFRMLLEAITALAALAVLIPLFLLMEGMAASWGWFLTTLCWAVALTMTSFLALIMKLTSDFTAVSVMSEGVGITEGFRRGALRVINELLPIYYLLVHALLVLLAPLMLYWFILMIQAVTMNIPGLGALVSMMRFLGELVLLFGFALFNITMWAMYFSWYVGRDAKTPDVEEADVANVRQEHERPVSLDELMPGETLIHDAEAVLDIVHSQPPAVESEGPADEPLPSVGPFSLDGILKEDES